MQEGRRPSKPSNRAAQAQNRSRRAAASGRARAATPKAQPAEGMSKPRARAGTGKQLHTMAVRPGAGGSNMLCGGGGGGGGVFFFVFFSGWGQLADLYKCPMCPSALHIFDVFVLLSEKLASSPPQKKLWPDSSGSSIAIRHSTPSRHEAR